jgi:hypothetical protein
MSKGIAIVTGDGDAESLKTTGVSVDVGAAAPPTAGQLLTAASATTATWQDAPDGTLVARVWDSKSAGQDGGPFTSGAWRVRDINVSSDPSGQILSSISGGTTFTVFPGSYLIEARAPAHKVASHKAILRDVTTNTDRIFGSTEFTGSADDVNSSSWIRGTFTVAINTSLQIWHQCSVTKTIDGFGRDCGFAGIAEIYTDVIITKIG